MTENDLPRPDAPAPDKPNNEDEVRFMSALYYAPRLCKSIASALDLGVAKVHVEKPLLSLKHEGTRELLQTFINFYTAETERARELMLPYSITDYPIFYSTETEEGERKIICNP